MHMPYKDPEKRKAYQKEYNQKYMPEWKKRHLNYDANWHRRKRMEDPERYKEYDKNRKLTATERQKNYLAKPENRIKDRARRKLRYALKVGKIVRPTRCASCRKETSLEPDHHDYTKPLDVVWMCRQCHMEITVKRLRMGIKQ